MDALDSEDHWTLRNSLLSPFLLPKIPELGGAREAERTRWRNTDFRDFGGTFLHGVEITILVRLKSTNCLSTPVKQSHTF